VTLAYDAATKMSLVSVTRRFTQQAGGPLLTATTGFDYDPANPGRVNKITPPRGSSGATTITYGTGTAAGMPVSVTDALGNKATFMYDPVGRRTGTVDPMGNAAGGVPADHTWLYVYDKQDRLISVSTPPPASGGSPLATQFAYDEVGNRITVTDPRGQMTRYLYDERNRVEQVQQSPDTLDPNTSTNKMRTLYTYDDLGNLQRVERAKADAVRQQVDYIFDGLGRLRREVQYPSYPANTPTLTTTYTYDPNGNRTGVLFPNDQGVNAGIGFQYDALNRLTGVDFTAAGISDVGYTYDAGGNVLTLADGTGTTTYEYDERNRAVR
jgi:YD repeat-containing protein